MSKLLAFHNDPKIKEKYLKRVKEHAEADEIVKGQYWQNGKGCAVGCTIEGSEHKRYETELGIPEILARLEDGLFEEMPKEEAMKWPLRFLQAIPVGADLSQVFTKLVIWEWEDEKVGLKNIKEIKEDTELFDCCEDVVKLYKRTLNGEEVSNDEWVKLEKLSDKIYWARAWAWAGARARAGAGAWAWAGAGARAGAWAGAGAGAGAGARAWAGARAEYEKQISITAEKLLDLLKESK